MGTNTDDLLLGLCSAVDARSLTCGYNLEQLPLDLRELQQLSDLALTPELPPSWLLKTLTSRIKKRKMNNDNQFQNLVISDAICRYRRGVGTSLIKLEQLKNEYSEVSAKLSEELPTGLISKTCEVNQTILHNALSPKIQSAWSKGSDGEYKLDTGTLLGIDTPLTSLILEAKRNHKINIVNYLTVDEDGRHRSWPNPYGTTTGREHPKGGSYVFWSKGVQLIIEPRDGYVVVKIDFDQQEPAILAAFSGSELLLQAYEKGDLYSYIYENGSWENLSRKQFKTLIISYLYGIQNKGISEKWNVDLDKAQQWRLELDLVFMQAQQWMNASSRKAYSQRWISSMDWGMHITNLTSTLTVKNWPIQAAGADILRRSCLKLANNHIDVIGCLHDAVMIEIPIINHDQTIKKAQKLMADASADVLSGFRLKTSIEKIYWSKSGPS